MKQPNGGDVRVGSLPRPGVGYAYQFLMIVMCIYGVVAMGASAVLPLGVQALRLLEVADQVLCAVFLVDFLWTMKLAENKARYFFRWGWLDLISSIPAIGFLRIGRLARADRRH